MSFTAPRKRRRWPHAHPSGSGRGARLDRRRRRRGATLVESIAALAVIAIGCVAALSVLTSSLKLDAANRENAAALRGARAQLEAVRAESVGDILVLYDADGTNDPGGANTAPGASFTNASLGQLPKQSTVTATVLLPISGGQLREDLVMPELGMPADLNGDGAIDALDHRDDAVILPVGVRVTWEGALGSRTYQLSTMVYR